MKKSFLSMSVFFVALLFFPNVLLGESLPDANNPIWTIFNNLKRPDDPKCVNTVVATLGVGITEAGIMCNQLARIPEQINTEMTKEGILGTGKTTTDLKNNVTDWRVVENLTFDHDYGTIRFTKTINFMSRDFMQFMTSLSSLMEMDKEYIDLNADLVAGLKNTGAVITMKNVSSDLKVPEILVNGVEDTENVVSSLVYNSTNRTATFNAAHFTSFKLTEGSDDIICTSSVGCVLPPNIPKIDKVKIKRYLKNYDNKKKDLIVARIYGNNFSKQAKVTIDGKDAYKVEINSNKDRLTAYFKTDKLKKTDRKFAKFKVINPGNLSDSYKKTFELKSINVIEIWKENGKIVKKKYFEEYPY